MILVHKPLHISSPAPAHFHRRLPSAPHVSVQPTRTPGLLSIVPKQQPPRSSQPQRSQQRMTPLKENQRHNRSPKPANSRAQSVNLQEVIKFPVVESTDKPKSLKAQSKNPTSTPDKSSSPRNNQKRSSRDKAPAERGLTPAKQTRRQARQPSPVAPAQIEATSHAVSEHSKNPSSNFFDPFLTNSSDSDHADTKSKSAFKSLPPPKLGRPSGKLANRRQQANDATSTPTKAIPVPRPNKGRTSSVANISRSAPVNDVIRVKPTALRAHSESEDTFPICDDMTDIDGEASRPSTPVQKVPTWQQQSIFFDDGPRTAPLSSTTHNFPFTLSTPSPAIRKHHRAPSDGVFNMSFDEDSEASEGSRNLFSDLLSQKRRTDGQKAGYFASSQFQNSPSPEDLPAPDFIR